LDSIGQDLRVTIMTNQPLSPAADININAKTGFNFEKLEVYQKSIGFIDRVYSISDTFPEKETFGLISQFRRAAVSISLNIAEGSARTKVEFNRFLNMAKGSLFECIAILEISKRRGYVSHTNFVELRNELICISKMLSGLKRSLTTNTPNPEH